MENYARKIREIATKIWKKRGEKNEGKLTKNGTKFFKNCKNVYITTRLFHLLAQHFGGPNVPMLGVHFLTQFALPTGCQSAGVGG